MANTAIGIPCADAGLTRRLACPAGGGLGFLTGEAVGIPRATIKEIKASLAPGTSAVIP